MQINREIYDQSDEVNYNWDTGEGLTKEIVIKISKEKNEPEWMLSLRLKAFELFKNTKTPNWGPDLSKLDLDKITYYRKVDSGREDTWEKVPENIKRTFEKLGIPEAERRALAGAGAQYESDVVYHNLKKEWEEKGVVFEDCDVALQKYPEMLKKYFMTNCIPINDHKFIMLHAAVWSGGTFIYVPKNVKITLPLQAYFRMNAKKSGQFEHTLIIADEGSEVQYIEGCSAPIYQEESLHAGCVEIYVKKGARVRYSSVENWSRNTYNLNTKRAIVEEDGIMEWIGGNLGSGVTMLYPCTILKGKNSRTDHLSIAFAGENQHQDVGSKVFHLAENTKSVITSKSICKDGGITTYRGLALIKKGAKNSSISTTCDALILDEKSKNYTTPCIETKEQKVNIAHEATVGKISAEKLFYLQTRGLKEEDAIKMIVSGFIQPLVKQLPLEYALEFNKLIELEMEGSVG